MPAARIGWRLPEVLVLALLVAVAVAFVPPAPPMRAEIPAYTPDIEILCWPSGLQVVAVRTPGTHAAAITTVIDGGSGVEDPAARGAAHLLEHLWFRSTPGGGPSVWYGAAGLSIGATTRLDSTVYTTVGASSDLPALLALEGQRLVDPLVGVTAAVVASEREVVKSEQLLRGGATTEVGLRVLEAALYPEGHPYHGSMPTAAATDALTLEHVRAYAAKVYRPARTTVRLEGALPADADDLAALIDKAFPLALRSGTSTACGRPREARVPGAPATRDLQVVEAPVWNQRLFLGWTLPPGYDPGIDTMIHAADLIGTMLDQRLPFVAGLGGSQRERAGAGCSARPGHLASDLVCRIDVPLGIDPEAVLRHVREGLVTLWTTGADHDRFVSSRAASVWTGAMWDATALHPSALETRALWSHFSDEHESFGARLAAAAADGRQVAAFGREWLGPARMAAALVRPADVITVRPASDSAWVPRIDAPPPRWTPVRADPDALVAADLPNGATLWVVDGGADPAAFVHSAVLLRGGSVTAPVAGLHEAFEAMAVWSPTTDLDAFRRGTASSWWPKFGREVTGTGAWSSAASLPAQLWQSRLFLEEVTLDSGRRQGALDDEASVFDSVDHAVDYVLSVPWVLGDWRRRAWLLDPAPTGLPWWERNRAARAAKVADVRRWQSALWRPANTVVIVSGDVDKETAYAVSDKYLGGWRGKAGEPPAAPPSPGPLQAARIEVLPLVRSLTQVAASCRVPAPAAPDDAALDVLVSVLRRGMWQTLREDGRTYTPGVWIEPAGEFGVLHLEAEVLPGEGVAAVKALLGLLRLVADGRAEGAVPVGKIEAASRFGQDLSDTSSAVSRLAATWAAGDSIDDLRAWPTRLRAVDAPTIARLLDRCVGHEAITLIGADDPAPLAALGLPVEVHDPVAMARALVERMD